MVGVEVEHENRDRFDGMARRLEDLQTHTADVDRLAVAPGRERVLRPCPSTQTDGGPRAISELEMAGDEVGVEMGQEHVANPQAVPFGRIDVPLHVALRIDDDGRTALAVADKVRRVGETIEVELLENHGPLISAAARSGCTGAAPSTRPGTSSSRLRRTPSPR